MFFHESNFMLIVYIQVVGCILIHDYYMYKELFILCQIVGIVIQYLQVFYVGQMRNTSCHHDQLLLDCTGQFGIFKKRKEKNPVVHFCHKSTARIMNILILMIDSKEQEVVSMTLMIPTCKKVICKERDLAEIPFFRSTVKTCVINLYP